MKKLLALLLVMTFLGAMIVPAQAAEASVIYVSGSSFRAGGTVTVDDSATSMSVMSDPSMTADMYNAALEKNMTFFWKCSNGPSKFGQTITWSTDDIGREYVCQVAFFSGPECADSQYVGDITGDVFIVSAALIEPNITTTELPSAVVGDFYQVQVECNDLDADFSEFMGSQLGDFGLSINRDGLISGTPTKSGNCHVNLQLTGAGGEDYESFDITVYDAYEPGVELLEAPKKLTYYVGEKFDPTGMRVQVNTYDGSTILSENGKHLTYYKEPLQNVGEDIKIKLSYGDLFTFVHLVVKPAPVAEPTITTTALPDGTVGQDYNFRLSSSDPDATFEIYHNPGGANDFDKTGLVLTQHGDLEGKPTAAGTYTFTICASGEGGEGYKNFTLQIVQTPATDPTTEAVLPPDAPSTPDDTEATVPEETTEPLKTREDPAPSSGLEWWVYALIAVAALGLGTGVAIFLIKRKK